MLNVVEQLFERIAPAEAQAALAFIGIGADDLITVLVSVNTVGFRLVVGRMFLMLGGHADILSRPYQGTFWGRFFTRLTPIDNHWGGPP